MKNFLLLGIVLVMCFFSCRKKDDPVVKKEQPAGFGKISFTIDHVVGDKPLFLGSQWYVLDNGDSLKINQYKYYFTNIVLHSDSGNFKQKESYYLIDESNPFSKYFVIDSVPQRRYTQISFLIGVDEARNTSGAQTGALDPAHAMFWDWNTGYIMAKLEGISPQASNPSKIVSYHIAGFKAPESVLRTVTLTLPQPIEISPDKMHNIHLQADVGEWFKNPHVIKLTETSVISTIGEEAQKIADNYADMFKIDHID